MISVYNVIYIYKRIRFVPNKQYYTYYHYNTRRIVFVIKVYHSYTENSVRRGEFYLYRLVNKLHTEGNSKLLCASCVDSSKPTKSNRISIISWDKVEPEDAGWRRFGGLARTERESNMISNNYYHRCSIPFSSKYVYTLIGKAVYSHYPLTRLVWYQIKFKLYELYRLITGGDFSSRLNKPPWSCKIPWDLRRVHTDRTNDSIQLL